MTEHTKLPWIISKTPGHMEVCTVYRTPNAEGYLSINGDSITENAKERLANAELIVKAVNNHDKLIRMLKLFISLENVSSEKHALLRLSDCGHSAKALLEELK